MARIGVIGDRDSVLGYAALGLDVQPVEDARQAAQMLRTWAQSGYAIVYITEDVASQIGDEINQYRSQRLPAILPIPGIKGNAGMGIKAIHKSVEQAVGSDILFGGNDEG